MLEEERRLCYVGMTRAEKRLYLTWARMPPPLRRRTGRAVPALALPGEVPAQLTVNLHAARLGQRRWTFSPSATRSARAVEAEPVYWKDI